MAFTVYVHTNKINWKKYVRVTQKKPEKRWRNGNGYERQYFYNAILKYGDRNWEKGIPCHSFADSAMRHFVKYMDGWTDEDHLIAAIWNLCGLAWTEEKHPELMDIPARMESD